MSFLLRLTLWIMILNSLVNSKPIQNTKNDPEYQANAFEGDMVLTPTQKEMLLNPIVGRNGLIDETKRWPNRVVSYKIIGDFDQSQLIAIRNAIAVFEARTCIRFREANSTQTDYVAISSKPGGCYTAVGYRGKVQEMNLAKFPVGNGCFRSGTILHEFMHALGFYHEQSAADRDRFVKIVYENITPGKELNFKKYAARVVTDFDVGYDYNSCLHYRSTAFSANGKDTVVPLDPKAKIGQRDGLSKNDIAKINVMYKCPIPI